MRDTVYAMYFQACVFWTHWAYFWHRPQPLYFVFERALWRIGHCVLCIAYSVFTPGECLRTLSAVAYCVLHVSNSLALPACGSWPAWRVAVGVVAGGGAASGDDNWQLFPEPHAHEIMPFMMHMILAPSPFKISTITSQYVTGSP